MLDDLREFLDIEFCEMDAMSCCLGYIIRQRELTYAGMLTHVGYLACAEINCWNSGWE